MYYMPLSYVCIINTFSILFELMSNYLIDCEWGGLVHILVSVQEHVHILISTLTGAITCTCTLNLSILVLADVHVLYTK